MNTAGDSAEQMVRMSLQGVEVVGKLSLESAEHLIKLIAKAMKSPVRTKGRATLSAMLKSQRPIKVFELNDRDLKMFCREAKKYGVMYHVLKDRKSTSGKCDIMVRSEDSAKVNRIFQRFNLGANNKATIQAGLERSRSSTKKPPERQPEKNPEDIFIDELFSKPLRKELNHNGNPSAAKTEKSRPSEPTSSVKSSRYRSRDNPDFRPSVREKLKKIQKKQQRQRAKQAKQKDRETEMPKTAAPVEIKSDNKKGAKKNVRSR